jgi:Cysteine-rich secretory protein family
MASAIAAIVIVPSAVLQRSHAQSDLANTVLAVHNRERAAVGSPELKWSDSLAADAMSWAEHLVTLNQGKPLDERSISSTRHERGRARTLRSAPCGEAGRLLLLRRSHYSRAGSTKSPTWAVIIRRWSGRPRKRSVAGPPALAVLLPVVV